MKLTIEQMNSVNQIIIRFLKEQRLYKYIRKDLKVISYNYISSSYFLDTTLANFARNNMNCIISLDTQLIFVTEYITKLTEKTTEELFMQFLEKNNISFKQLLNLFKNNHEIISKWEYQNRLYIIKKYKPHIISALSYCHHDMDITDDMNLVTLRKKWKIFYAKNIKFV